MSHNTKTLHMGAADNFANKFIYFSTITNIFHVEPLAEKNNHQTHIH